MQIPSARTIRQRIFNGSPEASLQRQLKAWDAKPKSRGSFELRLFSVALVLVGALTVVAALQMEAYAGKRSSFVARGMPGVIPMRIIKPMVPDEQWREMKLAPAAPEVLSRLSPQAVPFMYNAMLPVGRVDGAEIGGKLPAAVWLKLEQPGNAILLVETDEGTYIKVLEEMSPGYVSRCSLRPDGFGTLGGEPAYLDPKDTTVKALWVIQDAAGQTNHTPGWVSVMPPENAAARTRDWLLTSEGQALVRESGYAPLQNAVN